MELKRKYPHKKQDIDAVFLFGFYCQLASRRLRIEASTLDSSNAAGRDGLCTKNILHGQAEMRTQISSFSSRRGRFLTSIPLLLLSPCFHVAPGCVICPMAGQVISTVTPSAGKGELTSNFKTMRYVIAAERSFSMLGRRRAYTKDSYLQ